jgi:hypothetical protein
VDFLRSSERRARECLKKATSASFHILLKSQFLRILPFFTPLYINYTVYRTLLNTRRKNVLFPVVKQVLQSIEFYQIIDASSHMIIIEGNKLLCTVGLP